MGINWRKIFKGKRAGRWFYDRQGAAEYARQWYDGYNPAFPKAEGKDCTNFISQCLYAGGAPEDWSGVHRWYHGPRIEDCSITWATSHSLYWYLMRDRDLTQGPRGKRATIEELEIGDLIFYNWEKNQDNAFNHTRIIIGFDEDGKPLCAQHTEGRIDVPWDDNVSENVDFRPVHILSGEET